MRIPVTGHGTHAWVEIDRGDFVRLPKSLRLWRGRAWGRVHGQEFGLARILLGVTDDASVEVDHLNRNPLDNRRVNLRLVPAGGPNSQNVSSHRDSRSCYRGVAWDKTRNKWVARVWMNGRNVTVGRYDDEMEAGRAAREYRLAHMQYARD